MAIHEVLNSNATLDSVLANGAHYVILLDINNEDYTEVISTLQQIGLSADEAKQIYTTVIEQCEVATLYPKYNITLLPPYFWYDDERREKYFCDLLTADNLINSTGIYVKSDTLYFGELLSLSKNKDIMKKEWYLIG
ncbi:MAG: hypothetical protein ACI4QI_01660 [Candidatus Coproplasma sp.]